MRPKRLRRTASLAGLVLGGLAALVGTPGGESPPHGARVPTADAPARSARVVRRPVAPASAARVPAPAAEAGATGTVRRRIVPGRSLILTDEPARGGPLADIARDLLREHGPELGLDALPGELVVAREFESLSGHHLRYRQVLRHVPVFGSEVSVHVAPDGRPLLVHADVYPVGGSATTPATGPADALAAVHDLLRDVADAPDDAEEDRGNEVAGGAWSIETRAPRLVLLPEDKGARLSWLVEARTAGESVRVFVDALEGDVRRVDDLRRSVDGVGMVFDPNPVHSQGNASLRDDGDRDSGVLNSARVLVTLPRLDGGGELRGDWADVTPTPVASFNRDLDWSWVTRSHHVFEQVMCYYHVDRVQDRLQSLGITGVNAEPQRINAHALTQDQSFYDPFGDELNFGDGGVDDGEDADVVVHEYAHALQYDQVANFGATLQGSAMGEGFGDFLAVIMHESGRPAFDPLVASWDATSYSNASPPYLRRVDRRKRFPADYRSDVHADGEIWSRFLWDLRALMGADDALRVAVESHFFLTQSARFQEGANAVIIANAALRGGRDDASIRSLLDDRGLPYTVREVPLPEEDAFEENDDAESAADLAPGTQERLLLADEDWYRIVVAPFRRAIVSAEFDPERIDLDMELYDEEGRRVAVSFGVERVATVEATATDVPRVLLLRCFDAVRGGGPGAYDLTLSDTDLEAIIPNATLVRRIIRGGSQAFRIVVPAAKVEERARLRVRSIRLRRGATNGMRLFDPDGTEVLGTRQTRRRRGALAVTSPGVAGDWVIELRPRGRRAGRYRLRTVWR